MDPSQPPGSSFFPNSDQYSGDEIGFPVTTLGVSTNPYLVESMINILDDVHATDQLLDHHLQFPSENQVINLQEMYDEQGVYHLLLAYVEAIEMDQEDLAKVMAKRIGEKVSPAGDTVERLMYYMFQNLNKQSDYLKQESARNFYPAFKAFYTMFPNGKFAHFAANSAIFGSLTNDIKILRIFDFDIGEGIQWASLMEDLRQRCPPRELVVTAIKLQEDADLTLWKFEDTKKRLSEFAESCGLILKVEQMQLNDMQENPRFTVSATDGKPEFIAFNAMLGLPHMGRKRNRKAVFEFFEKAQDFLKHALSHNQRGVIIFGDGDVFEKFRNVNSYSSFLDMNMKHYQTLLESIYFNFPPNLGEARTCMECLFVAPFVSCNAWAKAWEEAKNNNIQDFTFCFKGLKIIQQDLVEAKEIVKERESLYGVRIEGNDSNQMVMDWRGIPLVRVSCWRN